VRALREPGRRPRGPSGGLEVRLPGRPGGVGAGDGRPGCVVHRGRRPAACPEPAGPVRRRRAARGELGRGARPGRGRTPCGGGVAGDGRARLDVVHGDEHDDGHDHPCVLRARRLRLRGRGLHGPGVGAEGLTTAALQ